MFRRSARLVWVSRISVAVIALGIALLPKQPPLTPIVRQTIGPDDVWPAGFVVHKGDRSVGVGQLVARDNEPTRLCTGQDAILQARSAQYRCSLISVELRGLDVRSMARSRDLLGAVVVDGAVVHGTWNGEALRVDAIGGNALRLPVSPPLTCEYDVPGASSAGATAADVEEAFARLRSQIYAGPEAYAGSWPANDGNQTVVVATTDDLVATGKVLRQVFPFALCLVRVSFSTAALTRIQEGLLQPDLMWWPAIAEDRNKVLARVPVLDDAVLAVLAGQPAIEPMPLLMRER